MTQKPNFRRGMTMAEILICVAMVAIAVVMVVSFSVSMGGRTRRSNAQLEAREEVELVESVTRSWLNNVLSNALHNEQATEFSVTAPDADGWGRDLAVKLGPAPGEGEQDARQNFTLTCQYKRLTGTRPTGEAIDLRLERVTGATFFVTVDGDDALFYCRVTYQVPMSGSNQMQELTHVFCVNPHIGE